MLLSVMMPALECRPWEKMAEEVGRQRARLANPSDVELLIELDDGRASSGAKRNLLTRRSRGDYRAFVDDDDLLAPDYLEKIVRGCRTEVDVVSFNLRMTRSDRSRVETWKLGPYPNYRQQGLMCVNQICAWRRELTDRVSWCPYLGYADDQLWFQPLLASGLIKTHHHYDEVLYHYVFNPLTTANQSAARVEFAWRYVGRGLDCYRQGDEILIQSDHRVSTKRGAVRVRDRYADEHEVPGNELVKFHTVQIQ